LTPAFGSSDFYMPMFIKFVQLMEKWLKWVTSRRTLHCYIMYSHVGYRHYLGLLFNRFLQAAGLYYGQLNLHTLPLYIAVNRSPFKRSHYVIVSRRQKLGNKVNS